MGSLPRHATAALLLHLLENTRHVHGSLILVLPIRVPLHTPRLNVPLLVLLEEHVDLASNWIMQVFKLLIFLFLLARSNFFR